MLTSFFQNNPAGLFCRGCCYTAPYFLQKQFYLSHQKKLIRFQSIFSASCLFAFRGVFAFVTCTECPVSVFSRKFVIPRKRPQSFPISFRAKPRNRFNQRFLHSATSPVDSAFFKTRNQDCHTVRLVKRKLLFDAFFVFSASSFCKNKNLLFFMPFYVII